jgi:large subunit ribosomal protein L3
MGPERVTTLHLEVVRVLPEQHLLAVRGAVPGATGGLLLVRKSRKESKAQRVARKKA